MPDPAFWSGRKVLLTGHTGFKGSWAALWLNRLGARVSGFALPPEGDPNLWSLIGDGLLEAEALADIRDPKAVSDFVHSVNPSIVLHMAAQPLVRRSFAQPVETFATNIMGTVHLLEAMRGLPSLDAALIVTTDKVYRNDDSGRDFVEDDPLGGHDPYSASKAGAEVATASYAASFFGDRPVATARAGNVIGGGDWSEDRLVPDLVRAVQAGRPVELRNPGSTRPWQHVLDPVSGYLTYLEALATGAEALPRALNFGPSPGSGATVAEVTAILERELGASHGWTRDERPAPAEMHLLSLNPALAQSSLGWRQRLTCQQAIEWTADWYRRKADGEDARVLCLAQITAYQSVMPCVQE